MKSTATGEFKGSGISWVGTIPARWEVSRAKALFGIRKDISGEIGHKILSITQRGIKVKDVDSLDGQISMDYSKYQLVRIGDFAMNHMDLITGFVDISKFNGVTSPDYRVFFNRDIRVACSSYYLRCFQLAYALKIFYPLGQGASHLGRWRLPSEAFNNYLLPLPPLPEQHAIAQFLDRETAKIDALIAEQERLIALLKEKRAAVISQAVTKGLDPSVPMKDSGVPWLGEVPAHWEVVAVKRVVASIEQGWSPQCEGFPVSSEDEWGVLKVGCVNGGQFNPRENKTLPLTLDPKPELGVVAGDLYVSRANTRELVGSAAVALSNHPNLMVCDKLYRVRLKTHICQPAYVSYYIGCNEARSQIQLQATGASSSMLNIGQSVLLELPFPIPPIEEQINILSFITKTLGQLDDLVEGSREAIALLQERRTALISAAVTGQIDLREAVGAEA